MNALNYVKSLQLQLHPEGGYYREVYRSAGCIPANALPPGFTAERSFATSIYFLLEQGNFSAFHRIRSDETWHFYSGDTLEVIELEPGGGLRITRLGSDPARGEVFQYTVLAGRWFGSRVAAGGSFSLVGCTVAPGFDFADFEMGDRHSLTAEFPAHKAVIAELTRNKI